MEDLIQAFRVRPLRGTDIDRLIEEAGGVRLHLQPHRRAAQGAGRRRAADIHLDPAFTTASFR